MWSSVLAGKLLLCMVASLEIPSVHQMLHARLRKFWASIASCTSCILFKICFSKQISTNSSNFYINYYRLSSSSRNPKRTSRGTRSSSVVVARERPTTVNASVFAARLRTSTNLPNTVSSFVSPINRLFARLLTLSSTETGF